ncbi:MAG: hypothetical protein JNJ99_12980 [Crocinitomicaceae bacterium]|nr:hypothetical protein [Crocinitomicaceae bacterium]
MKGFFHTVFVLFIQTVVLGQLNTPIKGDSYSTARKEIFNGFIGENSTTLFSIDYLYLSRKKQELIVRKFYKNDLKLVDSKNIYEVPPDGFYGEPVEVFYNNDTIYMFSNLYDEQEKTMYITMEYFDVNGERLFKTIIDTIPDDEELFIEEENENRGFVLLKSHKFSNLTEQEIDVKYVRNDGSITWMKTLKSPMALQNLDIEHVVYEERTPLYILCNYNFEPGAIGTEDERSMINNKYALWAYDPVSNFLKEFEIRMKGKWANGVRMQLNANNQLVLAGFFNETRYQSMNGMFSLIINPSLSILNSVFYQLNEDDLAKFIEEKDRGKVKELEDYQLNEMAMLENGSYFLLGERYYKYIERTYDPRTNITTTTEHYNYNSIIVSYFDSLGNHLWTDRVPKFQTSTNDFGFYSSFTFLNTGKELYLFFNDSEKNNELALNDYFNYKGLFNNRRFQVSYVQLDSAGLKARGPIIGTENSYILRAKDCNRISEETMYLFTELGRDAKVFSVSVKKK